MTDREKVIEGLGMCKYIRCESKDCPYYEFINCREVLHRHALALIREQQEEIQRLCDALKPEPPKEEDA